MPRSLRFLFALALPAVLFACGGSSSGTGASTTTTTASHGGNTTTSSTTHTTTTSTTATGAGGAAVCEQNCTTSQAAAYAKFQTYLLADCGCASGSACNSDCASACPSGTPSSACNTCLLAQANMQTACTTSAGTTCIGDSVCMPFVACELACME